MRIAILIALSILTLGLVSACGGSETASGTIGGELTVCTGTNLTSVRESSDGAGDAGTMEVPATTAEVSVAGKVLAVDRDQARLDETLAARKPVLVWKDQPVTAEAAE